MKKAILPAICSLLSAVLLTGCGAAEAEQLDIPDVSGRTADVSFTEALDGFALGLLRGVQTEKPGENVTVSPYSVMQALAMTANGAAGDTLTETEQLFGGIPVSELNQYLSEWRAHQPDSKTCKLLTANAVWFRDGAGFTVKDDFLERCRLYYDADAFREPFDAGTVKKINQWTSKHTDRMIPKLIDGLSSDDTMVLTNAVCFDAKWAEPYKDTQVKAGSFTAADGTEQPVKYLSSAEAVYLEADGTTGFLRPYDGDCAFVGILPPKGVPAEEYLNGLTREAFEKLLVSREETNVLVKIPEFAYDTDCELTHVLNQLGMQKAFTAEADFSGMSDTPQHIGKVIHKTHIEVDAAGTKAAAATAVTMRKNAADGTACNKFVLLERPFIYMILDTQNDLPLFIGTVQSVVSPE